MILGYAESDDVIFIVIPWLLGGVSSFLEKEVNFLRRVVFDVTLSIWN